MLSMATFGVGFAARPLGGMLIGLYADRVGRKPALTLTLWMMALGSILFVVAPTYAQVGIYAPILIVLARLIQGFAIGGEMGASMTLLMEYADDHSRGYFGSWQFFSQGISVLLGSVVGLLLTNTLPLAALESWGWRIPFMLGLLVIPVGLYIRRHLSETISAPTSGEKVGLTGVFVEHGRTVVAGILIVSGGTSATYIVLHYMTNYAVTVLKMPLSLSMWAGCIAALVQVGLCTIAGRLSDRIGRKPSIRYSALGILLLIYPIFLLINAYPTLTVLLFAVAVLAALLSFTAVSAIVLLTEIFPRKIRATGLSIVNCFGVLVFGGFAQFYVTWLINLTGDPNMPAFYVMGCTIASLVGLTMVPETANKRLD